MSKSLRTIIQTISGVLAISLVANLLVHIPFYIIDGNLLKLFDPIWMYLDVITLALCLIFVFMWKKWRIVQH